MTLILSIFLLVSLVLILVFRKSKVLFLIVPLVFAGIYLVNLKSMDLLGIPIQSKFLVGSAIVLKVIEGEENIYVLVKFTNEDTPKFVVFEPTEENKEKFQSLTSKGDDGVSVISFNDYLSNSFTIESYSDTIQK